LAKIAINCCLVASVSVANTLAELCERIGADWSEITPALKLDARIGQYAYLSAGLGISGGNLERDLATVLRLSWEVGSDAGTIAAFARNSQHRKNWVLKTLHRETLDRTPNAVVGILGLAYKENTHSTKNSPSIELIRHVGRWPIRVYDPVVAGSAMPHPAATACATPLEAARGVDALVIMTPWPEFKDLPVAELAAVMRGRTLIDPYRLLDRQKVAAAGLHHITLGAPPRHAQR
jgi:UDPglucose 6-dehydrogenase